MKIQSISIANEGYITCKSRYYQCLDIIDYKTYNFSSGINSLYGEIDSGNWAISCLLSLYRDKSDDFILTYPTMVEVNGNDIQIADLLKHSCYMDESYPLFSKHYSVDKLVSMGIRNNGLKLSAEDVRDLFHIDAERFSRPISGTGNEVFKCMAAIGYVNNKQVFCFPWMSQRRIDGFHKHLSGLLSILETLDMIVILPSGM